MSSPRRVSRSASKAAPAVTNLPSTVPGKLTEEQRTMKRTLYGYADATEGATTGAFLVNVSTWLRGVDDTCWAQVDPSTISTNEYQSIPCQDKVGFDRIVNAVAPKHGHHRIVGWCIDPERSSNVLVRCVSVNPRK